MTHMTLRNPNLEAVSRKIECYTSARGAANPMVFHTQIPTFWQSEMGRDGRRGRGGGLRTETEQKGIQSWNVSDLDVSEDARVIGLGQQVIELVRWQVNLCLEPHLPNNAFVREFATQGAFKF